MFNPLTPSRSAWLAVGLLWLVALLNYLDRLMITTMREPIRADIAMTDAQFGLLTSVLLWVYAATSPLAVARASRSWPPTVGRNQTGSTSTVSPDVCASGRGVA